MIPFRQRAALAVIGFCVVASTAAAAEPSLMERFGGVRTWDFYYVYSASSPYRWDEGLVNYDRVNYEMSQSGRARLTTAETHRDSLQLEGRGRATAASYDKVFVQSSQYWSKYRYDRGSGAPDALVRLTLRLDRGTYAVDVQPGKFPVKYGGTDRAADGDVNTYGPSDSQLSLEVPVAPTTEDPDALRLPKTGVVVSGSYSFEEQIAWQKRNRKDFKEEDYVKRRARSGTIKWVLVPADVLDVQLVVEPQDYDAWLPQGGKDEATAGNAVAVKATLLGKDGGPPSIKARRMTFRMMDASREPGVCLNQPLKDARTTPDLAFEPGPNKGWTIGDEGLVADTPEGEQVEATATLSCFDWGATGTMMVTAELTNGRTVVGTLKGSDASQVLFPKRAGSSKIADRWKATFGFDGADDEDNDKQAANANPGDGLTAYEEYRGLLVRGAHTREGKRIDPHAKDLFVENRMGASARPGLAVFRQASGIRVVEMDKGELPESRLVNANHGRSCGGEQFGLRLIDGTPTTGGAGENRPAARLGKTPKWSDAVVVDVAFAKKNYAEQAANLKAAGETLPYTQEEEFDNTVAHEVAHGVHAPHHGPASLYRGPRAVTVRMRDWAAYGVDGVKIDPALRKDQSFPLAGTIGLPGNEASGDSGCIMAYTGVYQWAAVGPIGGPYRFYAVGPQPVGKHFCTSPKAAGMNLLRKLPDGTEIPGFFGDATSVGPGLSAGNCLGQMRVRDW